MKKNIYFGIIGVGAVLAIIGFFPGGFSGLWGILIAGIAGVVYYFNTQNEKKVQERLEDEQGMFKREAGAEESTETVAEAPVEDAPAAAPTEEAAAEETSEGDEAGE